MEQSRRDWLKKLASSIALPTAEIDDIDGRESSVTDLDVRSGHPFWLVLQATMTDNCDLDDLVADAGVLLAPSSMTHDQITRHVYTASRGAYNQRESRERAAEAWGTTDD